MNNNNNPNRRRPPPSQGQGRPPRPNPNPPRNPNPNGNPPRRNPQGQPSPRQGRPQNPSSRNPPNGQYRNPPPNDPRNNYGYNYNNNYGNPPQNMGRPSRMEQEQLRRRQEIERRQAEARRQQELDRQRREKQRQKELRKREFKQNLQIFGGRLLVFAVILLILCGLTAGIFFLFFNSTPDAPDTTGKITYYYGGAETRKAPIEEAVVEEVLYVCFNDVADYLGMLESGSADAMKFIFPQADALPPTTADGDGTEEIITFYTDSNTVRINGQTVTLDTPNLIRGTEVWVPLTFLEDYINNLSVQCNKRRTKIEIARILEEAPPETDRNGQKILDNNGEVVLSETTAKERRYLPISFKLKSSAPHEAIDEAILGSEE